MKVEICSNSRRSAQHAKAGGADRIELCSRLEVGGTTPQAEDITYCVQQLQLRTHVLVRPREGNFTYSDAEFALIWEPVEMCKRAGAHAVVVGFLTPDGRIDVAKTRHVVELAAPMEVTFHRAFDEMTEDPLEALEKIIGCGCHRILTSGCRPSAEEGIDTLRQLVQQAAGRIVILAGAGVTPKNAARIARETGVTELHGSCKHTISDGTIETDTDTVKALLKALS
jgi:copper homeostasis protein